MKKHLIAAAVAAAVAVPAAAQVTVYGTMDIGYTSSKATTGGPGAPAAGVLQQTANGVAYDRDSSSTGNGDGGLSTSVLGFRAAEDLGGGLKADVHLQYDLVDAGNGGNTFGARVSTIGINGGFGRVQVGRDTSAIHSVITAGLAGMGNNIAGSIYSAGGPDSVNEDQIRPHGVFTSDMISFTTPTTAGFTGRVDYSKNSTDRETTNSDAETKETGFSLRYDGGPLKLGVGYQKRNQEGRPGANVTAGANQAAMINGFFNVSAGGLNGLTAATINAANGDRPNMALQAKTTALSASYDFKQVMAFLLHTRVKMGLGTAAPAAANAANGVTPTAVDFGESKATEIGVRAPFGATTLFASMYDGKTEFNPNAAGAAQGQDDLSGHQLGATYSLSKRTTLYAIYGTQKTEFDGAGVAAAAVDSTTKHYAFGVRHTF